MKKIIRNFYDAKISDAQVSKFVGGARRTWENRKVAEKGLYGDDDTYIDYEFDGGSNYLCNVRD